MTKWVAREAGLRFLARRKAGVAMAVLTMSLALGANSAAFSVLKAFLLSSFALPEPGRTLVIAPIRDLPGRGEVIFAEAYPNYELIRETQRSFEEVACVLQNVSSWDDGSESRTLQSSRVTATFFATTGVWPVLGRGFEAAEEGPSPAPVVIISHSLWEEAYDGRPDVLGRVMNLNGAPHTIVGVMPPDFAHPLPTDIWLPFDIPDAWRTAVLGGRGLGVYGLLKEGMSRREATREMEALTRRAVEANADNQPYRYALRTIGQLVLPGADRTVVFVQVGALMLTLLAVVNLASLLIAWGYDRSQEMAVRVALGARGRRVAQMLVLQSLAVVAGGAVGGLALARVTLPLLRRLDVGPELALYLGRLELDGGVLVWSIAIAAVAAVAAGILPAVLGRNAAVGDALRTGPRGVGRSPAGLRWQKGMVLAQALLTVLILASAALIGVSFRNLSRVPDGFSVDGRVVARVQLTGTGYAAHAPRVQFARRLLAALAREPELVRAGFTSTLPVGDQRWGGRFLVELPDGTLSTDPLLFHFRRISDSYFEAIGLPLLQGRAFEERDDSVHPPVAVVSRALATRLWPDEDPLGKPLYRVVSGAPAPQALEVVGVVGDAMDGGYGAPPGETVYVPYAQISLARMSIVVRARTNPELAIAAVRRSLRAADPVVAAGDIAELETLVRSANALPELQAILLMAFAIVAIGIVGLGSYGLMSQLVACREREFALRLAVGASVGHVGAAVLRQAARISLPGVIAGIGLSWLLAGAMRPFLFGVDPRSVPVTAAVAVCTLLLVGVSAVPPAVRAMRVKVGSVLSQG